MKASRMIVGEKYKVGAIVGTYVRMNGKMIVLENNGTEVHANPNDKIKKYTGEPTESLYTNKYPCKACGERKLACEFRRTKNGGLTHTCLECLSQAQSRNARNRWKNKKQEESK